MPSASPELKPLTLPSTDNTDCLSKLESPELSLTRVSLEPSCPHRPQRKCIADVSDTWTPERYKFPRISCPEIPQSASHTEHRAGDCPSQPTISGISSLHNVAATPARRVPIPIDPFVNTLSDSDLTSDNWMGFQYTVDELFEHGVTQDPPPFIQRYDSHFEMDFPPGVKLFLKQDSLAVSGGNSVNWSILKDEIKRGIGKASWITTFLLKPNSMGSSTMLVAKCGKVGILFQTLAIWQKIN